MSNELEPLIPAELIPTTRQWYEHKTVLIGIFSLFIVSAFSIWWYFQKVQVAQPSTSTNLANNNQATNNKVEYKEKILEETKAQIVAKLCAEESNSSDARSSYVAGQLGVILPSSLTKNESNDFVKDLGYKLKVDDIITRDYLEPEIYRISFGDSFNASNQITVDEVNSFLDRLSKEKYIKSLRINGYWNEGFDKQDSYVNLIDRWGSFTIGFVDEASKLKFFTNYPEATFFIDGDYTTGTQTNKNKGAYEATILYKAKAALKSLNEINDQIKIEYNSPYKEQEFDDTKLITFNGVTQGNCYEDRQSCFMLDVPMVSEAKFKDLVKNYPELIFKYVGKGVNFVVIQVPAGQEECYSREIKKHDGVEDVFIDQEFQVDW